MTKKLQAKPALIFQLWSGDGIFFEKETHEILRQIQRALENSKTWGEFRAALPPRATGREEARNPFTAECDSALNGGLTSN
jgi:hypothetical protein